MISPDMFPSTEMKNCRKMRLQFRKLHFRKRKAQQRTFDHACIRSKLQNGISLLKSYQMAQMLWHWYYCRYWRSQKRKNKTNKQKKKTKKKQKKKKNKQKKQKTNKLFNSSLQSGWNVVSQLTLTYSLIAAVIFEIKFRFRVSSFWTNFLRSFIISFQNANRKWSGTRCSFTLA